MPALSPLTKRITGTVVSQALSLEEAAAHFGHPASYIEAISRGPKIKGKETLPVPASFMIKQSRFVQPQGSVFLAMARRELRGDGRLILAIEHSTGSYPTAAAAQQAVDAASRSGTNQN